MAAGAAVAARDWPVHARLRDGTAVAVRPLTPDDRAALADGFQRLSARSRFHRFHSLSERLTEQQLRYLTEIDQRDHIAIAAFGDDRLVGVARAVRLGGEPAVAEAAVTVEDSYQGRGLGTLLLTLLAEVARANGVATFRSYVLAENAAMLDLFAQLGATRGSAGPGMYVVDFPVPDDPDTLPRTAAGRAVRAASRGDLPVLDLHLPIWDGPAAGDTTGGRPSEPTAPTVADREAQVWLSAEERELLRGRRGRKQA